MTTCDICERAEESTNRRGGPSGLPKGWISSVGITVDDDGGDIVNPHFSGVFCSYVCWLEFASRNHSNDFHNRHSVRPEGIPSFKPEVVETREMQSARIGLTVLDIVDVLQSNEIDGYGALIPLTAEYEGLLGTYVLTVGRVVEDELPEGFRLVEDGLEETPE